MRKHDTRAWIRVVEAVFAVLLVAGFLFAVSYKKTPGFDSEDSIYAKQRQILDVISKNNDLRNYVFAGNYSQLNKTVILMKPNSWKFQLKICNLNDICSLSNYKGNVYASETIITANSSYYNPKKLKLFVWMG